MPSAAGGIMNPNFGILKNGTIVVGYLTEEHILNLEWVNLVQGIIWLVRNKKVCFFFLEYLLMFPGANSCVFCVYWITF